MPCRWPGPLLLALAAGCATPPVPPTSEGLLVVALHTEPQTWNRLLVTDRVTHVVSDQLHEPLLRLDPRTQRVGPALAESWELSEDGTRLVVRLREGARFSDGEPLSARDVEFTFRALYDPKVASPLRDTALVDGRPLQVRVVDEITVAFEIPRRTAILERMFDSIGILPAHLLEESLAAGNLGAATGLGAPVEAVVGLGPFRLREYLPGERIVLERNPHYWKAKATGGPYPRLARLVFEILPDENARMLRFRAGEIDLVELITPDAFELLGEGPTADLELVDLGPGLLSERLWFNLNPEAPIDGDKKAWFQDVRFRRAVSLALDRATMAKIVFSGRASPARGPVSAANRFWWNEALPEVARDLERARRLLREAGFSWSPEGRLKDAGGREVGFTAITNAGNDQHLRMGAFLQQDLAEIGIDARTVAVEAASLLARITRSFDYEACLLGITQTDPDPSAEMGLWSSGAPLHLWNPGQPSPATPWEARIDELMERQMVELDPEARRESYHEVQRIVYEQLPVIDLVVPHALAGVHRRVRNLELTPLAHPLWNREDLFVVRRAKQVLENR